MRPNEIDLVLQRNAPTVVVPIYGEFEPLEKVGHRFLLARDGLWLEAKRAWAHIIWPIAQSRRVPIPAGELSKSVKLAFGKVPEWMVERFVEIAEAAAPQEIGAVGVWDEVTGEFSLEGTRTLESGIGHLKYERPEVGGSRHVILDLHSHGPIKAYFSARDVRDTGSEVVVAGVVGGIGSGVEVKLALFACGLQIPVAWGQEVGVGEAELQRACAG